MTFQNGHHQAQVGFIDEFYQIFKEEIVSILYTLCQNIEAEGILPNSFYKASITLIPKLDDITRKLQISLINTDVKSSTKY